MTDGPFRNLPLSGCWRKAADAIAGDVYGTDEVSSLIQKAMTKDVRDQAGIPAIEALKCLVVENNQMPLIPHNLSDAIELLRDEHAKSNFNSSLFRHVELEIQQGQLDYEGLQKSVSRALDETINSGLNSIKDHTISVATGVNINFVNKRCSLASQQLDPYAISGQLLASGRLPASAVTGKKSGLDQGVPL